MSRARTSRVVAQAAGRAALPAARLRLLSAAMCWLMAGAGVPADSPNASAPASQTAPTATGPTSTPASAPAPRRFAVVIGARGGDAEQADQVLRLVAGSLKLLDKAGFAPDCLRVFCDKGLPDSEIPRRGEITAEAVLNHLADLERQVGKDDELWVFLFGHANLTSRGLSIQTQGRRLLGEELAKALRLVPCKQAVLCLNTQSAALMPLLADRNRVVVTAANDPQQLNPPLLAGILLEIWAEDPTAPLLEVLRLAGQETEDRYTSADLVIAERAAAWDGRQRCSMPLEGMEKGCLASLRLAAPAGTASAPASRPARRPRMSERF